MLQSSGEVIPALHGSGKAVECLALKKRIGMESKVRTPPFWQFRSVPSADPVRRLGSAYCCPGTMCLSRNVETIQAESLQLSNSRVPPVYQVEGDRLGHAETDKTQSHPCRPSDVTEEIRAAHLLHLSHGRLLRTTRDKQAPKQI